MRRIAVTWSSFAVLALLTVPAFGQSSSDVPAPVKPPVVQAPDTPEAPPANDDCTGATVISTVPFTDTLNTAEATMTGEPAATCSTTGRTVWYQFTAQASGTATATTEGSGFDTVLDAFTGTCGALTSIACNDDAIGLQSAISFPVDAGATYYVRAGGYSAASGNLVLNFDAETYGTGICPVIEISGALGSGSPDWPFETGSQSPRLYRSGVSPTCSSPNTCSTTGSGSFVYDAYTIPNDSGADQCILVTLNLTDPTLCTSPYVHAGAYLDTFDPQSICTNYLADVGSSASVNQPTSMAFVLPADGDAVVVVSQVYPPDDIGCTYDLTIVGDLCSPYVAPVIQEIPALNRYGVGALVLVLGGLAFWILRRRG